jgi:hypothetical protein
MIRKSKINRKRKMTNLQEQIVFTAIQELIFRGVDADSIEKKMLLNKSEEEKSRIRLKINICREMGESMTHKIKLLEKNRAEKKLIMDKLKAGISK